MKKLNPISPLPNRTIITWWLCRALILLWGFNGLFRGYTSEFLQALFAIAFTHLWDMFQLFGGKSFITKVPFKFQSQLNVFICLGVCIGSTLNNRTDFTGSDIFTHFLAGYISAGFCQELLIIMQDKKGTKIAPAIAAMGGFAMAIAILVGWEIYEFTMDRLYGFSLQMSTPFGESGILDTMWDFIIGTAGSLAGMLIYAFRRNGKTIKAKKKDK